MDRLPDIQRAAQPNARPEANERPPRESTRTARTRATDKPAAAPAPEARADAQPVADRSDVRSTDRPAKFEVQAVAVAPEIAKQPVPVGAGQQLENAAQVLADLVAQQPALRAKAVRAAPVELTKAPAKDETAVNAPIALPVNLDAIAATSDAPAVEARPTDVHSATRIVAPAAVQQPAEFTAPERTVEAPAETRDAQPARDTERAADILRQVRVHFVPRTSEAHIQLEPRELGRVSIHVSVEDGNMRASVRAEKREALEAIQAHLPELRATLRDSGIRTQEFHFGLGLENQPRRENPQSGNRPSRDHARAIETRDPEHALLLRTVAAASGVDLYA